MLRPSFNKGFTLVELLVCIVIFVLMTGFVAVKYGGFSQSMLVNNLAYDIALTIREAQSYGVSVSDVASTGNFNTTYGVHFDGANTVTGGVKNNQSFILYADTNNDNRYTVADTVIRKYVIGRGNYIKQLCHNSTCSSGQVAGGVGTFAASTVRQDASVLFKRPSPAPMIYSQAVPNAQYLEIRISNEDSTIMKKVVVRSTGQISIEDL